MNFYSQNAQHYFDETVSLSMDAVYSRFLPYVSSGGAILDLGCGSGRDSQYFIEQAYTVTALDGCAELAAIASDFIGQPVAVQDFTNLQLTREYDGIWACASLLHLPKTSLPTLLTQLHRHLTSNGAFYLSLKAKNDIDEGFDDKGRFFAYYDMDEICETLHNAGFIIVEQWEEHKPLRTSTQHWLNIIAGKHE